MNPEFDPDVKTDEKHEDRDRRRFLLVLMGPAGILMIALIVSVGQFFAGIDGLRAITAYPPASEQDPPPKGSIPVLTGVLEGIRDLPIPATPGPVAAPSATPPPTPSASPTPALTLATDRGASAIVALGDLVPGDTVDRTITLKNTGTLGFRYTVSATQTASTLLWTDSTSGLQLTVATSGGSVLYAGPLSGLGALPGPATLAPGVTEMLRYTFTFPDRASDAFQGLTQDLTLVFTATQYP